MRVRAFFGADFDTVSRLLGQTWHAEHGSHAMWHGADELCAYLSRADQGFVATDDEGGFLGVVLVSGPGEEDHNKDMRMHWLQQRTRIAGMASVLGVNAREDAHVIAAETALVEEAAQRFGSEGVGEIELLIVAEEARGRGVGRALLREALSWLSEHGATEVRLVTDDACDWQVYGHLGMSRLIEREFEDLPVRAAFVYQGSTASLMERVAGQRLAHVPAGPAGDKILASDEELEGRLGALLDEHAARAGVRVRQYRFHIERDGRLAAGISAWALGPDLHVDMLAVGEEFRRQGLGSRLLAHVEELARQDGCATASVDTFSFQAPEYYPAHGYFEVFRYALADGTERIYFSKDL